MRSRSVVLALLTATAAVAARRFVARRRAAAPAFAAPAPGRAVPAVESVVTPAPERDAVVLPFTRPVAPAPVAPVLPARCGDTGGRTKAGAPCGARGTVAGRCHHHRLAA
jgi:hypothetical protein